MQEDGPSLPDLAKETHADDCLAIYALYARNEGVTILLIDLQWIAFFPTQITFPRANQCAFRSVE